MAQGYSSRFWILVSMSLVAVMVVAAVWVTHTNATKALSRHAMTAEEKAYLSQIEVTNARMSEASNYLGAELYYLNADVTNQGSRTIRRLDLQLEFIDPFHQVVLRGHSHPVSAQDPPLGSGKTRHLNITFEHLPAEWNQGPPLITPVWVAF